MAKLCKVSRRTMRRWRGEGLPHHNRTHRGQVVVAYLPAEVEAWLESKGREPGRVGRPTDTDLLGAPSRVNADAPTSEGDSDVVTKQDLALAELRRRREITRKYRIANEQALADLIPRAEVEADRKKLLLTMKAGLEQLPDRVTAICVGMDGPEMRSEVAAQVRILLEEMSRS